MKNNRLQTGLSYGALTSLISILISLALYFTGLADFQGGSSGWVSILILGLGIYLATEAFKKNNGGFMSTSDIVVVSLWIGLTMGFLSGLFSGIYMHYIDPTMLDKIKRMAEIKMEESGNSDEQIEMALSMMDKFTSLPVLLLMSVCFNALFGVIVGFVLSLFLKKDQPIF